MLEKLTPETVAGGGTVAGILITKIGEFLLKKWKNEESAAEKIRTELRNDIQNLRLELKHLEKELDFWKAKYYGLAEENVKLKADCERMESEIQALKASTVRSPQATH